MRGSPRLRRSLVIWLSIGAAFTGAFTAVLVVVRGNGYFVAAAGATAWWLTVSLVLFGGAVLLQRPDGSRVEHYGLPNGLTALRAWACWPLFLCAFWSFPHRLGFFVWCIAGGAMAMLDFADGVVARRIGPVTALGQAMDPAMDAVFFSLGAVGNVLLDILPWWIAMLILLRYVAPILLTPVVFLAGRRPELVHTKWGRRNTAFIGFIFFVCSWVRAFDGPTSLVASLLGLPLLVPSTVLLFWALFQRVRAAPLAGDG